VTISSFGEAFILSDSILSLDFINSGVFLAQTSQQGQRNKEKRNYQ